MGRLEDFGTKERKEEKNPMEKYPLIWKIESCLKGECRSERTSHRWSIPACTPAGLMVECYDCHKTRLVNFK